MSIAIRMYDPLDYTATKSLIYFSATTNFTRNYSNTVPTHPIDKDADISDHSSPNNAEYSISGIVSEVDVSSNSNYISAQMGEPLTNQSNFPRAVKMNDSMGGLLGGLVDKFVPDFLSQFIPREVDIVVDESGKSWSVSDVREAIVNATRGKMWNEQLGREETYPLLVEIITLDKLGNLLEKIDKQFLIASLNDNQDADTGDALFFDLSLIECRRATLETTTVQGSKTEGIGNTAASQQNKGTQGTKAEDGTPAAKKAEERGQSTTFTLGY